MIETDSDDGPLLRSEALSGAVTGSVRWTYDPLNGLASEAVNGGAAVTYGYADADGLLTGIGAMSLTRDPASGLVTGASLGSITETYGYNMYGELASTQAAAASTTLYQVSYDTSDGKGQRDGLGRISKKTELLAGDPVSHVYQYTYDNRGRLTDVSKDGAATSRYDYDANGNRINGPGLIATPVYDPQDRLTSYGSCSYAYTADGSLQTKTCGTAVTSYTYDAFGNLRHVTLLAGKAHPLPLRNARLRHSRLRQQSRRNSRTAGCYSPSVLPEAGRSCFVWR